jgi:hypothetical protein
MYISYHNLIKDSLMNLTKPSKKTRNYTYCSRPPFNNNVVIQLGSACAFARASRIHVPLDMFPTLAMNPFPSLTSRPTLLLEVPVPDMSRETIYDDEPKTEKEVEAHKECAEIRKAARIKEIQQLIEMSVGVWLDERQAQAVERDKKVQVLGSKMVYKRKYEISPTDGKEYFLKWKARLAAVGCAQEPSEDTVYLGTSLDDRAVYMKLPQWTGEYSNNGAFGCKSGLQSTVILNRCEVEYVALCSEVCEVKYLRSLMRELGHKQAESTFTWEDNKAAILIAENECTSAGRSKHIDVRYKFVAQDITEGSVRVRYTPTDMNLADVLTKAVPAATFERLVKLCLDSKRGEYCVKVADEKVN